MFLVREEGNTNLGGKCLILTTAISTSKKLTSKTAISNLNLTSNWIGGVGGWGLTADDDRGCYDPI
jgi:hypothetical protein